MPKRAIHPARSDADRRGSVSVAMIIALVIANLVILSIVIGGSRDHDLTVRRMQTARSFYAAEAGWNMAMREVVMNDDEDGDGEIGSISDDGNDANDPVLGSARLRVEATSAAGQTTLTSRGWEGESQRRLSIVLSTTNGSAAGLIADYFVLGFNPGQLSDVDFDVTPDYSAVVSDIDIASTGGNWWSGGPDDNFAARFTGNVVIPTTGNWTFYTNSDDGSKLWINGVEVVDNDGLHGMTTRSGMINLSAGNHQIEVQFFERGGGAGLIVSWEGPGVSQEVMPVDAFTH